MSNLDDLLENYEGGSGELDLDDLLNQMEPSSQPRAQSISAKKQTGSSVPRRSLQENIEGDTKANPSQSSNDN
jgi:hypothetical protein